MLLEMRLGFRKEDRKRNRQCITISPLSFENLTTSLNINEIQHHWSEKYMYGSPDIAKSTSDIESFCKNCEDSTKHDKDLKDVCPYNSLNSSQCSVNGWTNAQQKNTNPPRQVCYWVKGNSWCIDDNSYIQTSLE